MFVKVHACSLNVVHRVKKEGVRAETAVTIQYPVSLST